MLAHRSAQPVGVVDGRQPRRGRRPRRGGRGPRAAAPGPRRSLLARELRGDDCARVGRAVDTRRCPPSAATRSPMPTRPDPSEAAAPPMPSSRTETTRLPLRLLALTVIAVAARVLDRRSRVPRWQRSTPRSRRGPRSARRSPRPWSAGATASRARAARRPGRRRARRAGRHGPAPAAPRSHRSAPSTVASSVGCRLTARRQLSLDVTQGQADRDEALLCPVVEVALEPPSLLIPGSHDPRPRLLDLGEPAPHLGAQPGDLDR